MPARACLVDGTAYLFRGYYSVRPMHAADGTPVNAIVGLGNALVRVLRQHRPTHVGVAFDAGRFNFRHRIDPAYKANRGDPPADLVPQFDLARALTEAMGLATFCVPDFEADDVLATLTTHARAAGLEVLLVSGDKDLGQLLEPGVDQYDLGRGEQWSGADLPARIGVRWDQVCDLLALAGDGSDNISGVRGVGPKAATALLAAFDDLDAIYARLDEVPDLPVRGAKTLRDRLAAGRVDAERSRVLATVRRDVPLHTGDPLGSGLRWSGPDALRLQQFVLRWNLGTLAERTVAAVPPTG